MNNNIDIRKYTNLLDKPIIVLLSGENNIGKTTLANRIAKEYNFGSVLHFADPVKRIAYEFGYDESQKRTDNKMRELLEDITDIGMKFKHDIWANKFIKEMRRRENMFRKNVFIVPDHRYKCMKEILCDKGYSLIEFNITEDNRNNVKEFCKLIDEEIKKELENNSKWRIICYKQ